MKEDVKEEKGTFFLGCFGQAQDKHTTQDNCEAAHKFFFQLLIYCAI